jgi:hypothetical protein
MSLRVITISEKARGAALFGSQFSYKECAAMPRTHIYLFILSIQCLAIAT